MPYIHEGPNLYLAADEQTIVQEGDPRAAFLLAATGSTVPDDIAQKHGLTGEKARATPANKLRTGAGENKSTFGDDEVGMRRSPDMLLSFEVVGQELTDRLTAAGYGSPAAVAGATDEQLLAIDGVGPKTLEKLRAATTGAGQE